MINTSDIKEYIKTNSRAIMAAMGIKQVSGRYFCPICQQVPENHRTPDMTLRGTHLKCWRCGEGNDVIGLYMKTRNVGFIKAVEDLSGQKFRTAISNQPVIKQKAKKYHKTYREAFDKASFGKRLSGSWSYKDISGQVVMTVVRLEDESGKTYRPISRDEKGWFIGRPKCKTPLYNLADITQSFDGTVFVVEGEKCADALKSIGLIATTSSGGANGVHSTDWSPLQNRNIIIWPDNDDAGQGYADEIKKMFPKANVFKPDCLPHKGDAYDWVSAGGTIDKLREIWRKK